MNYIDIFVCSVPTANRELYLEHAKATTAIFKAHGALKVLEGMKKFMADPRLESISMPFDGKRVIFGGFQTVVEA